MAKKKQTETKAETPAEAAEPKKPETASAPAAAGTPAPKEKKKKTKKASPASIASETETAPPADITVKPPETDRKEQKCAESETKQEKKDAETPKENKKKPADHAEKSAQLPPPASLPAVKEEAALAESVPPILLPEESEKKSFWGRLLLLLAVVAVLAVSAFIFFLRPAAYAERLNSVTFFYDSASDVTAVAVNGTVRARLGGAPADDLAYDARGISCAFTVGDQLYLLRGKKTVPVAQNALDFLLSQNGDTLAYRNAESNLCLYHTRKKQNDRVTPHACTDRYCLSPDGKDLAFVWINAEGLPQMDFYSESGKAPKLEKTVGRTPIAVADDCRYLYYQEENGSFCVWSAKKNVPAQCSTEAGAQPLFNTDFTEMLLDDSRGTHLYRNGEKIAAFAGGATLLPNRRAAFRTLRGNVPQYLVRSFTKNYFHRSTGTGNEIFYLNAKGESTTVSLYDGTCPPVVTDRALYFVKREQRGNETHLVLYHATSGKTEIAVVSGNVSAFCPNSDGSRILYTNEHNQLFLWKNQNTVAVSLRTEALLSFGVICDGNDVFYFCRAEGELMASDNGDEPRAVAENVTDAGADAHTFYYTTTENETSRVFALHRGKHRANPLP